MLWSSGPSPAFAAPRSATTAADESVSYRINPTHTGSQSDPLTSPIRLAWSTALGGHPSYPLIVGGRLYVIVENVDAYGNVAPGSNLFAFNASSGAVIWHEPTPRNEIAFTYDQGRLYLQSVDAYITAIDATTGASLWTASMNHNQSGVYHTNAPPVAANGVVVAMANDSMMMFDGATGNLLHDVVLLDGNTSGSPAIDGGNVYLTDGCGDYSVSIATGAILWAHQPGCSGGGGGVATVAGGKVYAYDTSTIFDESTGTVVGSLPSSDEPVAVDSGWTFSTTSDPSGLGGGAVLVVRATDSSGATAWTFFGDSYLMPPVLVANHIVYAMSQSGLVYLLDEATGHELFHVFAGDQIVAPGESAPYPQWSMAMGEGVLAVPTAGRLAVFSQATPGTAPTDPPVQQPPSGGYYINELPVPQSAARGSYGFSVRGPYLAGRMDYQTPTSGPISHPVIWTGSGFVDWTNRLPPGARSAGFAAVNSKGIAAGAYSYIKNGGEVLQGFETTAAGSIQPLPNSTDIYGINSSGVVAGQVDGPVGCIQAATWTNGTETDLPMGGGCGGAYAINDSGNVAGYANQAVWWKGGVLHQLGTIGGCNSVAWAIGPDDTVAGYSDVTTCGAEHHAAIWKNDVATDLGTAGGGQAEALAIAAQDQPVGFALAFGGVEWAVIWKSGQGIALGSLIDPRFGWILGEATGIDDQGRIVGNGLRYGEPRGFVLTPVAIRGASQAPPASPAPRAPANHLVPAAPAPRNTPVFLPPRISSQVPQSTTSAPDTQVRRLVPAGDRPRPF